VEVKSLMKGHSSLIRSYILIYFHITIPQPPAVPLLLNSRLKPNPIASVAGSDLHKCTMSCLPGSDAAQTKT
ncbi:hypothetical protein CCACVL1_11083, partial [Corchorus capsularis]